MCNSLEQAIYFFFFLIRFSFYIALNLLFNKQRLQQLAILLIINLFFLFKEVFVTIVASIDVSLFALLSKNLSLLIVESTLKSKNTTINKKVFANFFAKVETRC